MAITAAQVKELREMTGAGMMDAKKALTETDGDMEAAIDWLRTKGLAKAAKKAGRVAAEGLVGVAAEGGGDGQHGGSGSPQLAGHHLPLDLEAHHEEEDGHEDVVDELHQGERVAVGVQGDDVTDREADLGVPEVVVGAGPW